jgi:MFS family permease
MAVADPLSGGRKSVAEGLSRAAVIAIACGAFIVLVSFGIRSGFGLFLQPMSLDLGWGREVFALAMAFQNLLWGVSQPFAGAIADKWGTARTIIGGGVLYVLGVYLMSTTSSPPELYFSAGVLVGLGLSGTSFGVVLAAVSRTVPAERRSVALGITTAVGSLGQFLLPPIGQAFLSTYGWQTALMLLAFGSIAMVLAAGGLRGRVETSGHSQQTIPQALAEASRHSGYLYLTAGFFVCGWHIAFIAVHLPAYLADGGLPTEIAAWCLALVGLFNVIGSYAAGVLGGRLSKK